MNKSQIIRDILCILVTLPVFAPALDFSKSSLKAFDNTIWGFRSGFEDTITIHNKSNVEKVVDSLSVELDSPIYTQFEIGWMGQQNGTTTMKIFNSNNFSSENECSSGFFKKGITLSEYTQLNSSEKIKFKPNEKIEIFSPYISTCQTEIGTVVCCDGPCKSHYNIDQITNFNGRIIFFTGLNRDTLKLLCERTTYTYITGVRKIIAANQTSIQKDNHYEVNILGRRLSPINKLDAYHSIKLYRGKSIVLH